MHALLETLTAERDEIAAWRHALHRRPELALHEHETAATIAGLLRGFGCEVTEGVGGTGVVASISAGTSARAIGLRADTDALPIPEMAENADKSEIPGRSHACGHDGHTAMLLGAARHLARTRHFDGTVRLIFQPAEETMDGALAMLKDGLLERFPMQAAFGLHNMPGLEQGKLYFTAGPVMAAVDNWEIVLTGKGSHGSMPEKSIDPVVAAASLVMALQTVVSRNVAPHDAAVVSVGALLAGDAANVIPQSATLRISVRSASPETRALVLGRIKAITAAQAACYGAGNEIREGTAGAVLLNDPAQTESCTQIARALLGDDNVVNPGPTFMGSEDFAFVAERLPSVYAFIGNGDTPMPHHPMYRFEDRNLPIGAAYWVALAESWLR